MMADMENQQENANKETTLTQDITKEETKGQERDGHAGIQKVQDFSKAAPPKKYTQKVLFLNGDPGYHFDLTVLLYYVLGFRRKNHALTSLRRFLFLLLLNVIHHYGSLQMYTYYRDIFYGSYQYHFTWFYGIFDYYPENESRVKWKFERVIIICLLVTPLCVSLIQFVLLSPLLCRRKTIAEILYWDESKTALGKLMEVDSNDSHFETRCLPYETKLYQNLISRCSYAISIQFWTYLFHESLFSVNCKKTHVFRIIFKCCLLPVLAVFHILPIFSLFTGYFCKIRVAKNKYKHRCKFWLKRSMFLIGVACFVTMLFQLFAIHLFAITFLIVDVLRSLNDTLMQIIFLASAIVNIRDTLLRLEDKYRNIKLTLFNVITNMQNSVKEEEQFIAKSLLFSSEKGTKAIPKRLFDKVCDVYLPYSKSVFNAFFILVLKLTFLGLVYTVIVDYQVLSQFSDTGENLVTVVFVSIPSLLHKSKSDAQAQLECDQLTFKMGVTLKKIWNSSENEFETFKEGKIAGQEAKSPGTRSCWADASSNTGSRNEG